MEVLFALYFLSQLALNCLFGWMLYQLREVVETHQGCIKTLQSRWLKDLE